MADAEIIPIGTAGRAGRGSGQRTTPSKAARSLAPGGPPRRQRAPRPRDVPVAGVPVAGVAGPVEPSVNAEAPGSTAPAAPHARRSTGPAPDVPAAAADATPGGPPPDGGPSEGGGASRGSPVDAVAAALMDVARNVFGDDADEKGARALAFLRRRVTGDYTVDEFGYDSELTQTVFLPLLRPLYQRWFRVEVRGVENIPSTGGALVVSNHSGAIAVDALMVQLAIHDEHSAHRALRMLGADLLFQAPFLGELARKVGSTLGCGEDAIRLMTAGELVGVWPEGFKGIGKPFSERYKLQRFGRGGFVASAIRAQVPIVPCSVVGAEEIYPIIGNMPALARLLGLPFAPITPTWPLLGPLGMVPLPSKWIIEFGEPIRTDELATGAADDPMLVFNVTDQIRETIQQSLYTLLMRRRSVFF